MPPVRYGRSSVRCHRRSHPSWTKTKAISLLPHLGEHLRGLQASVEHPELVRVEPAKHAKAKLEADISAIRRRLNEVPRHPEQGGGPGFINLKAPFADLAAELHGEYGDALKITVGDRPFPPERTASRKAVVLILWGAWALFAEP